MRRLGPLLLALAVLGCPAKPPAPHPGPWEVFRGERLVLSVSDGAGALVSTAPPQPGAAPVRHPFLAASAHAPEEEDALKRVLDASESTADFLERLKSAGYDVRPAVH